MSLMALCGMAALLVHGLVDVPYFKNDLAILFWLIMALPLLEPRTHEAHRDPEWFELILSGQKTIEARLNDAKRQAYKVGDFIKINNRGDDRAFHVEIVELIHRPSFAELLRDTPPQQFGFRDALHGLTSVRRYYTPDDEATNGVVGIRIKVI
jgi:ASC-1-like (ASCH) protein